uniref:B30.2/SPRY domain-containing protein n=1 Tax=Poecilia reticulata TaxID=8081 RepID=A0A3P9Q9P2_POERE
MSRLFLFSVETVPDPTTRQELCMCKLFMLHFQNSLCGSMLTKLNVRFTKYDQVLCAEGLSGVCYWEVEWKGPRVEVAVWQSKDSCFGHNTLSWKIICSPSGCTFWHNSLHKGLIPPAQSRRVGVHLEYNEGKLSFYSVSRFGELTLLHRVQTTFRHPRPQFNDRLFRRINGSAAAYLGHSGEERCGAVH